MTEHSPCAYRYADLIQTHSRIPEGPIDGLSPFNNHQSITRCIGRAYYDAGKLVTESGASKGTVQPCAGVKGTTISVSDMFYNMPSRKLALTSPSEELSRIIDVVSRYSIDNPLIAMACKKAGDT